MVFECEKRSLKHEHIFRNLDYKNKCQLSKHDNMTIIYYYVLVLMLMVVLTINIVF